MILLLPGCCDTAAPIQNWLLREIEKYHLKRILCESLLKENWIKMILFWWIEEIYNCIVGPWAALLIHSTQISGCRMVDGPTTGPSPYNIHVKNYFYRIEFYLKCSQITDCESNEHWKCFGTMEFLPAWNPPSRCLMVLHIVAAK